MMARVIFTSNKDFSGIKAKWFSGRGQDFDGEGFLDLFVGRRSPIGHIR